MISQNLTVGQRRPEALMGKGKNQAPLEPCLKKNENMNILQTTTTSNHPPVLAKMSDCCFLPNRSFNPTPVLLLPAGTC